MISEAGRYQYIPELTNCSCACAHKNGGLPLNEMQRSGMEEKTDMN